MIKTFEIADNVEHVVGNFFQVALSCLSSIKIETSSCYRGVKKTILCSDKEN